MQNNYTPSSAFGFLMRTISILLSACLLAAALVSPASATHWRYAQITWMQADGNTVNVTVQQAWRRNFFLNGCFDLSGGSPVAIGCTGAGGFAGFGDIVGGGPFGWSLDWGDLGPTTELFLVVTSFDTVNNWLFGTAVDSTGSPLSHTYAAPGDYTAFIDRCCRIGGPLSIPPGVHINNPDGGASVETLINVGATKTNSSPVTALAPIVLCPVGSVCNFFVPGTDPDDDTIMFRLSLSNEAKGTPSGAPDEFRQPGFNTVGDPDDGTGPNAASIDTDTGLYTWDNTSSGAALGELYSSQVTIEDVGGPETSKIAVDFLIQIAPVDSMPPVITDPDEDPICDTTESAIVGVATSFGVLATDPGGENVTLNVAGLPLGATMTPSLPVTGTMTVTSTFGWTPVLADVGDHVVNFAATSPSGGFTLCPVTISVSDNAIPEAVDDEADADCGVDTDIDVLENDKMLFDPLFDVTVVTPPEDGTTEVIDSPNADPALIFVRYTSADGFDGIDTFEYEVTDGDSESSTAEVTVTVDGSTCKIKPGQQIIFNPDPVESDLPEKASVQRVIKVGTAKQTSCVFEVDPLRGDTEFDLVQKIKDTDTPDCNKVEAELEPGDQARLRTYQRAIKDPADNKKKLVVTLIRFKNLAGDRDQLTQGVAVSEEDETKLGLPEGVCSTDDVSQSPSTVGVNLSGNEHNKELARNMTGNCNRTRSFGHFSDHMLFYPIVNDSSFLEPHTQLNMEAAGFRFDLRAAQDFGCVDSSFLTTMIRDFNKAIRKVNNRKKVLEGICALQEVTLFSLDPDDNDPYRIGFCPNDVGGNLSSRLLALTWQAHRGVRFPDDDEPFQNDPRILCELPRLQGDPLLTCPTTELSPQCASL